MANTLIDTAAALEYFKTADPVMHELLQQTLSHPRLLQIPVAKPPAQYFETIVSSIIGQQISTHAASSIRLRVRNLLGELTPESVTAANFYKLKSCGLSEKKTQYLKHNAEVWHEIPYENFPNLSDEDIISDLIKLHGIGRWTAEMFLIFSLARPDVFSIGDLGLKQSLCQTYSYKPHFVRKIDTTVQNWSPHRTLAALTLWHVRDNDPVI